MKNNDKPTEFRITEDDTNSPPKRFTPAKRSKVPLDDGRFNEKRPPESWIEDVAKPSVGKGNMR